MADVDKTYEIAEELISCLAANGRTAKEGSSAMLVALGIHIGRLAPTEEKLEELCLLALNTIRQAALENFEHIAAAKDVTPRSMH